VVPLLQELSSDPKRQSRHGKAVEFLTATLAPMYTLVGNGVGVLYRHAPHPTRGVWLEQAANDIIRPYTATASSGGGGGAGASLRASGLPREGLIGLTRHVPLTVHGLSPQARALIASSTVPRARAPNAGALDEWCSEVAL
jgi:hypothetical protein